MYYVPLDTPLNKNITKCWFAAQETYIIIIIIIIIIIYLKQLYFFQDSLMNRKIQRSAFIWNKKLL